jgi:hypothetical protein
MQDGVLGRYDYAPAHLCSDMWDGLRDGIEADIFDVQKRAAMLASRSKDPGVIVDVPQFPTAEEVQAAKSGDGMVTPGLKGKEFGER